MDNNIKISSKPRSAGIVVDELALVKSAAWAWYQHGSESGSGSIREFDAWRTKIEHKPSRYKLEAALKNAEEKLVDSDSAAGSIILSSSRSSSNSLFDNYEIERISKQLNYYIEAADHHAKYRRGRGSNNTADHEIIIRNKVINHVQKKRSNWFRHTPVLCGSSRDDVVENINNKSSRFGGKGRRHVPVVEVVSCRPRCISA